MFHALIEAWPYVAVIAGGVLLVATFARDPKADEHDLSDYHEAAPVNPAPRSLARVEQIDQQAADYTWGFADDILPPAPEGMNAGSPLYAGTLFDTWFPETAEDIAARFLREIRDEALAGAR